MKIQFLAVTFVLLIGVVAGGCTGSRSNVDVVQIGVMVSDLDESFKFYTDILGMEIWEEPYRMSAEGAAKYGINSGKEFNIINLKLKCDGYDIQFKLNKTSGNEPERPFSNELDYYGFERIGASYFSIDVEKVEPYARRIEENNIKHKTIVFPSGFTVILVHDPDGVLIEVRGY